LDSSGGTFGILVAEEQNVSSANEVNRERKVTVAARVPPELAEAVRTLADAGDRTVSREVFRAIREHVDKAGPPSTLVAEAPAAAASDLRPAAGAPPEAA
jgi:hypothetical protein